MKRFFQYNPFLTFVAIIGVFALLMPFIFLGLKYIEIKDRRESAISDAEIKMQVEFIEAETFAKKNQIIGESIQRYGNNLEYFCDNPNSITDSN